MERPDPPEIVEEVDIATSQGEPPRAPRALVAHNPGLHWGSAPGDPAVLDPFASAVVAD